VEAVNQLRHGYLLGLGAYFCWGFFPLYFKLLAAAGAVEILAHRVLWSLVFVAALLAVLRRWRHVSAIVRRPRTLGTISLAAVFVAVNWGVYIYGVNSAHVVETSLGYFVNPLVTMLLGVVVLRERLRRAQWAALTTGATAVGVLAADYGRPPWIALSLAGSFGTYSLLKKRLSLPAVDGLLVESAVLALPALGYLAWLSPTGQAAFGSSLRMTLLLLVSGVLTAVPLLMFAGAASRLPLTSLGALQYVAPILQLACGVFVFHEPMPAARLAGFALVWCALAVFTWDGVRHARRTRQARAAAAAQGADRAAAEGQRADRAAAAQGAASAAAEGQGDAAVTTAAQPSPLPG